MFINFGMERGFNKKTKDHYKVDERTKTVKISILILLAIFLFSMILAISMKAEAEEEWWVMVIMGLALFVTFFANWTIIGIPSIIMVRLGKKKMAKLAKVSAIPLVLFMISYIPLVLSLDARDGPFELILLLYLEFLFILTVVINFTLIQIMLSKFLTTVNEFEKEHQFL
jgi:hypothetical protein